MAMTLASVCDGRDSDTSPNAGILPTTDKADWRKSIALGAHESLKSYTVIYIWTFGHLMLVMRSDLHFTSLYISDVSVVSHVEGFEISYKSKMTTAEPFSVIPVCSTVQMWSGRSLPSMSTVATLLSWPGVPELYVVASVEEHSSRYHGLYLCTDMSH